MTPPPCPYYITPSHNIFLYAPASVTPGHAGVPRVTHQSPMGSYRPFCTACAPQVSRLGGCGRYFRGGVALLSPGEAIPALFLYCT